MNDPTTGLTYPALSGIRKQSVEDVERLFGEGVIVFMEKYGYTPEAKYLRSVRNWRRSVDERGLPNSVRQDLGMEFLDFILEDLISGYLADHKDFRLLEVNRLVCICLKPFLTLTFLQTNQQRQGVIQGVAHCYCC